MKLKLICWNFEPWSKVSRLWFFRTLFPFCTHFSLWALRMHFPKLFSIIMFGVCKDVTSGYFKRSYLVIFVCIYQITGILIDQKYSECTFHFGRRRQYSIIPDVGLFLKSIWRKELRSIYSFIIKFKSRLSVRSFNMFKMQAWLSRFWDMVVCE